jgi:hypothetical protein
LNSSCSTPSKISCMISGIIPPPHMSKYFNCTNKLLWLIPYLLDTSTDSLSESSNSYKCCRWSSLLRSTNNFSVNYAPISAWEIVHWRHGWLATNFLWSR